MSWWISFAKEPSTLPSQPPSGSKGVSGSVMGNSSAGHKDFTPAVFMHILAYSSGGSVSQEPQTALYDPDSTAEAGKTLLNQGPPASRRHERFS